MNDQEAPAAPGKRGETRTRLGWVTRDGTLTALLADQAAYLVGGVALLSSPRAFVIASVGDDAACYDDGGSVSLADVFEARVFTSEHEFRWRRDGSGGHGVLLGETVTADDLTGADTGGPSAERHPDQHSDEERFDEAEDLEPLAVGYLLWGEPAPDSEQRDGWRTLSSARIGTIRVPGTWSQPRPARLSLRAREYLAVEPTYGNTYVLDERLVEIVDGEVRGG